LSRARGLFDRLERSLPPLAARRPRLAYAVAGALGSLRNRLSRRWPSPEQIQILFPQLTRREAHRIAWEIAGNEGRNRLLIETIRRAGPAAMRPLVATSAKVFAVLRPPLVLGMFHTGAIQALNVAVERLPGRVLVLRQGLLFPPVPPVETESTDGDGQRRAAAFRRALLHLKEGGFVVLALDVVQGASLGVSCLGRPLELARGPFALARLTGAPIRPLVARWERGRIGIVVGDELEAPAGEGDCAAASARWLERYLAESPVEVGLGLLRALLGSALTRESGER
jgi:lauroyl/myristoyl acyltransferase